MDKHVVQHFKKDCISCGACAAIAPEYWEMDSDANGFSSLKEAKPIDGHWEREFDTEEARAMNQEAADVCPVNIIHVKKKEVLISVQR
ncbi:ferredoxin [Candidatus Woesearchaeota archaeon]|nr:ferredoxin [Candidatus Woesearchaeota archaeon]